MSRRPTKKILSSTPFPLPEKDPVDRLVVIREILSDPFPGRGLTVPEADVARLASRGKTVLEISTALGKAEDTVKHQLDAAAKKIRAKPRAFPDLVFEQIEAVLRTAGRSRR